jgi:transcription elongation factor Elf1
VDEEAELLWQDVLDAVSAGRERNLRCPFCQKGEISVDRNEQRMRLECRACRRFIEGRMTSPAT